ncbi:MAG TPA: rhomboid family intramembrane serine protease [bacterium]|nr:rhomboid family intramembrane serine protease [bacterium]
MIGTIANSAQAKSFSDFLLVKGIPNQVEVDGGQAQVWVHDDAHLAEAEKLFAEFQQDPRNQAFYGASGQAAEIRSIKRKLDKKSRVIDVRTHWHRLDTSLSPVTAVLIGLSVALTLLSYADTTGRWIDYFYISNYQIVGPYLQWRTDLPEVLHGQVWRLVTPIFLHSGLLHILFNMLWLKDLGTILERKLGSLHFLILVLAFAILSNLGQYWMKGPNFGGMSGVVYGLLGYVWIRGRVDPHSGLSLNQSVVTMMILWFFLCLTGLMGPVANWAHGVGLAAGMLWGFFAAKLTRA